MAEKKCMKCGREAQEGQAFCPECLADMEKYPVKPGVVVLLPRHDQNAKPNPRRRQNATPPEEQLQKLKRHVATLWLALLLALGAAGAMGWLLMEDYLSEQQENPLPGQNYSSEESSPEKNLD